MSSNQLLVDISNQIATDYVPTAPIDVDEPDAASDSE
jgi:hypothetical protein